MTKQKDRKAWAAFAKDNAGKVADVNTQSPEILTSATITLPYLLPGMNGSDGLIRQHRHQATKKKNEILTYVKSLRLGTFGDCRAKVIITRYYCGSAMDFDNAVASFKYFMDAIVKAGIIADDGPKTIEEWTIRQVKAASRKEQKMEVQIFKIT